MELVKKIKSLPKKPGVYLFKSESGEILYVGKAKNLKNRVSSYFHSGKNRDQKTVILTQEIYDLEYIIVSSELESLILENNLIKKYKPRFNIRLRDDKNYQFIKIDYGNEIPQIYPVRKIPEKKENAKYFGPYTSAQSVKQTLRIINNIFGICKNKKIGTKSCFAYHLGKCPGICTGQISLDKYKKTLKGLEKFLNNKQSDIVRELHMNMVKAAAKKQFEIAASYRNQISALRNLWEKQKIIQTKPVNQDYIGIYQTDEKAMIYLLKVRYGKLIGHEQFELFHHHESPDQILTRFAVEYYLQATDPGKDVFLPTRLSQPTLVEDLVWQQTKNKISFATPLRGKKISMINLANENAKQQFRQNLPSYEKSPERPLQKLAKILQIKISPHRIEGFDISNIQGTNAVGSMVVFVQGIPDKNQYRKFKINLDESPNDVAMMKDMIARRFSKSEQTHLQKQSNNKNSEKAPWQLPDLIIIDGGKAQLNAASSVLRNFKLEIPIIGLAKQLEEIYSINKKSPVRLRDDSEALHLLQRIRDEAHRFAVGYHIQRRSKNLTHSVLDDIPMIGPETKKKLLQKFGSVKAIRQSTDQNLESIIGRAKTKIIKEYL